MVEPLLLTVDEAAARLSVGRSLLYGKLLSGEIPSVKVGRRRLVPVAALENYVEELASTAEEPVPA